MKKKTVAIVTVAICLAVTGCGKGAPPQNEVIDILASEATNEKEATTSGAKNGQDENINSSFESCSDAKTNPYAEAYIEGVLMKAGELWFMSGDAFENWCSENYPEIADNLGCAWNDVEWDTAKILLYKTVFGNAYPEWAENDKIALEFGAVTGKTEEEIEQEWFNLYAPDFTSSNVLYFEPPTGFIESKTTGEKRNYFKEMFVYLYDSTYLEEMQKAIDLMSDEEIEGMAADMARAIEKTYPNYTYSKGDENRKKTDNSNVPSYNNITEYTSIELE